jgi:thiol peroxidase
MAKITLKGNPVNISGTLPSKGATAPGFTLVKSDLSEMALGETSGKRVVLNIFPSLETSVCASAMRKFNEKAASLKNTVVLAISKDLPLAAG